MFRCEFLYFDYLSEKSWKNSTIECIYSLIGNWRWAYGITSAFRGPKGFERGVS